jgi:UDP-glucose 4-epimerase
MRVFDVPSTIQIIGTRHGEKHYESLLTQEEYARAQDLGSIFASVQTTAT